MHVFLTAIKDGKVRFAPRIHSLSQSEWYIHVFSHYKMA